MTTPTDGVGATPTGSATWAPDSWPDGKRSPQKAQVDAILGADSGEQCMEHGECFGGKCIHGVGGPLAPSTKGGA